jgi:glutathione S-transferase
MLTLVIGDKHLSSWSLRPWMLLRHLGLEFEELRLPRDAAARAVARSVSAEMHAGFAALRGTWPMKAAARGLHVPLTAQAQADVARVDSIWSECRARHGRDGPWLFGERYSVADAMYAPVALRFNTYGAELSPAARAYFEHVRADPSLQDWIRGAEHEVSVEHRPVEHP